jgi:hypothetical protein
MRAIKVLMVSVSLASSLVVGAAVTAPASAGVPVANRWCC